MSEKICQICNKKFETKRKNQLFCGHSCASKNNCKIWKKYKIKLFNPIIQKKATSNGGKKANLNNKKYHRYMFDKNFIKKLHIKLKKEKLGFYNKNIQRKIMLKNRKNKTGAFHNPQL